MKLKTNLFERITQHFYEDGADIHWWVDEEDEADFILAWSDDNPNLKKTDTRQISGKQWNEFWIGGNYGDYEGVFVNEICPEKDCDHLLVDPKKTLKRTEEIVSNARFCSDCNYQSVELIDCLKDNDVFWEEIRCKPPEKQIRLVGEDIFEFTDRVGLDMERENFYIADKNYWSKCMVCKDIVPASDFYIGQDTGFAVVHFKHDNCTNGGPSIGVTFTKKAKQKWVNTLGK